MKNTNNMTFSEILEMQIEDLNLSVRTYKGLKRSGLRTIKEFIVYSEKDFLNISNFGTKSLLEFQEKLSFLDPRLHLGMTEDEISQILMSELNEEELEEVKLAQKLAEEAEQERISNARIKAITQGSCSKIEKANKEIEESNQEKQKALEQLNLLMIEQKKLVEESERLDALIIQASERLNSLIERQEQLQGTSSLINEQFQAIIDSVELIPSENDSEMNNGGKQRRL